MGIFGRIARWRRGSFDPLACQEFVELVTDYLEGALPAAERARFESHLGECHACTAYFESLRLTIETLRAAPPEPPSDPHAREVLLAAFRELRG